MMNQALINIYTMPAQVPAPDYELANRLRKSQLRITSPSKNRTRSGPATVSLAQLRESRAACPILSTRRQAKISRTGVPATSVRRKSRPA